MPNLYRYYAVETVQSSQVTGTLSNFAALFARTSIGTGSAPDFRSVGNGGKVTDAAGADLNLFTDTGLGTLLDQEKVYYSASDGRIIKWARVASIATSTTVAWGYGNSTVTTPQGSATGVWNANVLLAWNTPDGSTLTNPSPDSTGNAYDGSFSGTPTAVAGPIANTGAAHFVGASTQYLSGGAGAATTLGGTAHGSISFWVNRTSSSNRVVGGFSKIGALAEFGIVVELDGNVYFQESAADTDPVYPAFASSFTGWHHIAWTYDGTQAASAFARNKGYFDGDSQTLFDVGGSDQPPAVLGTAALLDKFYLGYQPSNTRYSTGDQAWARVWSNTLTADWVKAEFNNQSAPTTFWGTIGNQTFAPIAWTQTLTGSIGSSGACLRQTNKAAAGAIATITGACLRTDQKLTTGTIATMSGALLRTDQKVVSGAIASTGACLRTDQKAVEGVIATITGALLKSDQKALTGAIATITGACLKQSQLAAAGAIATITGACLRQTNKATAGVIATITGALDVGLSIITRTFDGAIAPTGACVRQTQKTTTGDVASAGVVLRATSVTKTGTIASAGALVRVTAKLCAGAITSSGAATSVSTTLQTLTGAITSIVGAVTRVSQLTRTGAVTPTGAVTRAHAKAMSGAITLTGVLATARTLARTLTGAIAFAGAAVHSLTTGRVRGPIRLLHVAAKRPRLRNVRRN